VTASSKHPPEGTPAVDVLLDLGCDLADANRHEDAADCFRRAAAMGSREAWFNLGNSLTASHRLREAADAHRTAAALGIDDAWLNLGQALSQLGDTDAAVDAYRNAAACGDPQGPLALAYEYREQGHEDRADEVLQGAASNGNSTAAAILACWRWCRSLDPALEPELRAGAAHHPDTRADLADLLRTTGQLAEARAVLEEGVRRGEVASMLPLGNVYAEDLDQDALAELTYRRAIDAGDMHCHHNLGVLLERRGDAHAAEMHYRLGADAGDALALRSLNDLLSRD
jgi:tetratricopeptide (TPR) repeat protein